MSRQAEPKGGAEDAPLAVTTRTGEVRPVPETSAVRPHFPDPELFSKLEQQVQGPALVAEALAKEQSKDGEHRRGLRDRIENKVFWVLGVQIALMAGLLLLQGFRFHGFHLNEWAFGVLVNGSLVQTYLVLRYIVSDSFPGANGGQE